MSSQRLYSNVLKLLGDDRCKSGKSDLGNSQRRRKTILKSSINPGACVFCNNKHDLRSMHMNYMFNNVLENYTEMLLSCFNLRLVSVDQRDTDSVICNTCVTNLRDAFIFRKKVESVDETFNGHSHDTLKKQLEIKKKILKKHSKKRNAKILKKYKKDKLRDKLKTELKFNKHKIKQEIAKTNEDSNIPLINFDSDHESVSYYDIEDIAYEDIKVEIKPKIDLISEKEVKTKNGGIPLLNSFALSCPVCGESFSVHRLLRKHYPIHFPNFLCDICGRAFLDKISLIRHVSVHSDQRHPCKMCKRTYANRGALLQHIKKFHRGEKGYRCTICPERFGDYSIKNRHQFEVHGLPCRTYTCETCDRVFYRNSKLSEHVKRLHLKQKNYLCDMCDMEFFSNGELTMHKLRHSGDKTFACEKCGKSFARKKTLTEHLKIHANLRAHKCTLCDKAFVQKCTLKGHMRTHQKCGAKIV